MEIGGDAEIQQGQAQLAMGQAVDHAVESHIWLPVHDFLIRHKLLADGVGVALDVVGWWRALFLSLRLCLRLQGGRSWSGRLGW